MARVILRNPFLENFLKTHLEFASDAVKRGAMSMVRPYDSLSGGTVVIAGAGPSLAEYKEDIRKKVEQGAHLWGCNRGLNFCHEWGLGPTHGIAVDSSDRMYREVWKDPIDVSYLLATSTSPLLLTHLVEHGITRLAYFHNYCGRPWEQEFYETQFPGTIVAGEGLNVANRAIDVATYMGYQTVILAGVDNGFPSDGHFYADGSDNQATLERNPLRLGRRTFICTDDMLFSATDIVERKRRMGARLQVWGRDTVTGWLIDKMPSTQWMQRNLIRWEQ